jgi:hypothetical protein
MLPLNKVGLPLILFAPLTLAVLLFSSSPTYASGDPWANAVQSYSPLGVLNPQNAIGAPDNVSTTIIGTNRFIVLDMGSGEEGLATLRVYFSDVAAQANVQVIFLDTNLNQITSISRTLTASTQPSTQDFGYKFSDFNKSYRYVRLTSLAEAGIGLDAVEALDFVGKTPPATGGNNNGGTNGGNGGTGTTGNTGGTGGTGTGGAGGTGSTGAPSSANVTTGTAATPSATASGSLTNLGNDLAAWWNKLWSTLSDWWKNNCSWISLLLLLIVAAETGYLVLQALKNRPPKKPEASKPMAQTNEVPK